MPDIILDIAVGISVNKTFHYLAPEDIKGSLVAGARVLVPFGSRRVTGTIIGFPAATATAGLKSVIAVLDTALPPELMKLAHWMSDYYMHPIGRTIEALVPKALSRAKPKKKKFISLLRGHDARTLRGARQVELLRVLSGRGEVSIESLDGFSAATIKSLQTAGVVEIVEKDEEKQPERDEFSPDAPPTLMPEQAEAVQRIGEAVSSRAFEVFLLHGVTGSGKTEVYLHAISRIAGTGLGAIVLVPEIALTPQLLSRFRKRFGIRVAVLHSGLTDRERADEYRRIQSREVDVAIGARSAVFAPFERLALVIVDEEHETSYKQEEGLRYHARDVAVMRAKLQNAVAVLGSATPSLESYYNAKNNRYRYLPISNRVDHRPMPDVEILDVKALQKPAVYSPQLIAAIGRRMEKREQALLLLNRRGFSSVLICRDCGAVLKCPSCSVSLTYHKSERRLKCHYCDFHQPPPDTCPACGGISLHPLGAGTQRIEEDIAALFPGVKIERMDSDSVKGRQAYDTLLSRVDRGEVDILLGTQMVAKGHDFPAVTLVGVVDADVGLNLPDFRSAEKTFQLITQAAGRAGRGDAAGEVVIQTMNPGHYSLRHSMTHDYDGFYREEIVYRTELGYPPVRRMIKVELRSADEKIAGEAAAVARNRIRSLMKGKETTLLGPAPSPLARVRGRYRFQLLLLSPRREVIRMLAAEARKTVEEKFGRKCRVIVDVDPVNLM